MLSLNDERWNGVSEPSSASSLLLKGLRTPGRFLIQYPGKELLVYPQIFWLSPPKPTSAIDSCSHRCAGFSSTGVDDSRELLHPLLPPFNLHNSRVRRASGFLLTAFSNATPHTFFSLQHSSLRRVRKSTSVLLTFVVELLRKSVIE